MIKNVFHCKGIFDSRQICPLLGVFGNDISEAGQAFDPHRFISFGVRGLGMLEQFGVTSAADQIYVQALGCSGQLLSELGASTGLSENEVRRGWEELVDIGVGALEADGSVLVMPPPAVFDYLIKRLERQHLETKESIERARNFVHLLALPEKDRSVVVLGEGVVGTAIANRLSDLADQTKSSVSTFAPGGSHTPERLEESRNRDIAALRRGVRLRSIWLTSALKDRLTGEYLEWLVLNGAEVRTTATLPMRMIIIDEETAIVPASPSDGMLGAVIVRNPSLVALLQSVFERTWATSNPFGSTQGGKNKPELLDEERAILELIALGQTDEQIAKATGLTRRMVRRVGDEMKAKLGAASRAAIGYLAVKKGWL